MSQLAFLGSHSVISCAQAGAEVNRVRTTTKRLVREEDSISGLSWLVAIAGSFLLVGLAGMLREEVPFQITLSGAAGMGASEVASQDTTMAELQAMEEAPEIHPTEEVTPEEIVDIPEIVEMAQELPELPELAEALVTEDVFAVPAAPPIEQVLTPVDPVEKPKPKPEAKPRVANTKPRSSRATTTAATTPGGTEGSGGGGGGNGAVGSGGRGRFPAPPYPSFARSRGIQGSVTLTIQVSPSGAVEQVMVARGTGFSELDNYAASWVRRNWRFPEGTVRSFRLPVSFKLR